MTRYCEMNEDERRAYNREAQRRWREKKNREKERQRSHENYKKISADNPEFAKQRSRNFRQAHPEFWQDYYKHQKSRDVDFNRKRGKHATERKHLAYALELLDFIMPERTLAEKRKIAKQFLKFWRVLPQIELDGIARANGKNHPYITNCKATEATDDATVYELNLKCDEGELLYVDEYAERGIIKLIVKEGKKRDEV